MYATTQERYNALLLEKPRQRVVVLFARDGRSKPQSFPRKRESTPQTLRNALPHALDSRFRGNDRRWVRDTIPNDTTTRQS
jgi:hypothetical protein